MGVGR